MDGYLLPPPFLTLPLRVGAADDGVDTEAVASDCGSLAQTLIFIRQLIRLESEGNASNKAHYLQ